MNINERIVEYLHRQDEERLDSDEREFVDVEAKDIFIRELGAMRVYYAIRQYPTKMFAVYYSRLDMVVPPTEESVSVDVDTSLLNNDGDDTGGDDDGDTVPVGNMPVTDPESDPDK